MSSEILTLPSEAPSAAPTVSILVADGVEDDRRSLSAMLRRINRGVAVVEAPDGATAQRLLRERAIDIAFIDRRLPEFDGREVRSWAAMTGHRSLFVLVSDKLVPRWREIATLINAYEVMLKPFNESHVENLLEAFGRLNQQTRVLVVDKSRTARKIIRDMLEKSRFNCSVDETDTGLHVMRAVAMNPCDVILVDAELDAGQGAETACRLARGAFRQDHPDRRRGAQGLRPVAPSIRPLRVPAEAVRRARARESPSRRAQALAALPPQRAAARRSGLSDHLSPQCGRGVSTCRHTPSRSLRSPARAFI